MNEYGQNVKQDSNLTVSTDNFKPVNNRRILKPRRKLRPHSQDKDLSKSVEKNAEQNTSNVAENSCKED